MKEYIEREAAVKEIQRAAIFNRDAISKDWEVSLFVRSLYGLINRLPAAPVREVVMGEWIEDEYGFVHCPICGMEWDEPEHPATNFCPNCGTDMREPVADIDVGRKEEGGQT